MLLEILQRVHEISSLREVFYKKGVLKNFSTFTGKHKKQSFEGVLSKRFFKNFANFIEKHPHRSVFLDKVQGQKLIKKRLKHRCFLMDFGNILKTLFCKISANDML